MIFGNKSEKPQAESCPDGKKVNPMFCFEMDQCSSPCLVTKEDIEKPVVTILQGQLNEFGFVIG